MDHRQTMLSQIPKVDEVLDHPVVTEWLKQYPRKVAWRLSGEDSIVFGRIFCLLLSRGSLTRPFFPWKNSCP